MRRTILAILVAAATVQACDFGTTGDEWANASSSLQEGAAVQGVTQDMSAADVSTKKSQATGTFVPNDQFPAPQAPGTGDCVYLSGGKFVLLPCPDRYTSGQRSHGDPQPWSPGSTSPVAPMD